MGKDRIDEILAELRLREEEKHKNKLLWILAIIGTVAAFLAIAYAIYRFFAPDYLEEFEDDFDDGFDEYFDDEEETDDADEAAAEDENAGAGGEEAKGGEPGVESTTGGQDTVE